LKTFAETQRIYWCICNGTPDYSKRHIQAAMNKNNLEFIILDYLAAKKSGILD